jgi:hypothetical protein
VEKPIEVITNSNPLNSPNGFLPYLKDGNKKLASYEKIVNYLKTEKVNFVDSLNYDRIFITLLLELRSTRNLVQFQCSLHELFDGQSFSIL